MTRGPRGHLVVIAVAFATGALAMLLVVLLVANPLTAKPTPGPIVAVPGRPPAEGPSEGATVVPDFAAPFMRSGADVRRDHPPPPSAPSDERHDMEGVAGPAPGASLTDLRGRRLLIPLPGLRAGALRPSFGERRSSGSRHEAIDILAPRNTPVLAVEDGSVAKLFTSQAGGLTIYQFDPTGRYAYYYAHLERYAAGLREGDAISRGQVIGYVGTSGNAPPDTPHLHFAIFRLGPERRWWDGEAVDPFEVWKE